MQLQKTTIDAYIASQSDDNLSAMIDAIVAATGGSETFDGGLDASQGNAGDKVLFIIEDGTNSVLLTAEAGKGAGTADTALEAAEVMIVAVFDNHVIDFG